MSTRNGVISRLHRPLAPAIGKCASGEHVGKAPRAWPTRPVRERRGVFPPEVRVQATAVACSLPQAQGVPLARWSRTELAHWVASAPSLPAVSASTIGRWLKAERIRPWRYHAWQRIQNPQTFLQRAGPVLRMYERASALLREGTWLVCVDEKTSIQAREAEQGPRAAFAG